VGFTTFRVGGAILGERQGPLGVAAALGSGL